MVSIYLRSPPLAAIQAATLELTGPSCVQIGLGVSTETINAFHWLAWDRPAARMREYVEIVRRVLAGERRTYQGDFYQSTRFSLSILPPEPVPICLAAVNPLMLRLAGEIADSMLLDWLPTPQL